MTESPIKFREARYLGAGRITALERSTPLTPGILCGANKGLFHLDNFSGKLTKIRKFSVGWIISGQNSVLLYETISGIGTITLLDQYLHEIFSSNSLARKINPKALFNSSAIVSKSGSIHILDFQTEKSAKIADIEPVRFISVFDRILDNFEFIATHRGKGWCTWLYSLSPPDKNSDWKLAKVVELEDHITPSIFRTLPNGDYLFVVPNNPMFWIYRIYPGEKNLLKSYSATALPENAHPSGVVITNDSVIAACADVLMEFSLDSEFSNSATRSDIKGR